MKPYTVTGPFGRCAVEEMRLTDQFRLTCRTSDCNTSRIFSFREEAIALARALAGIDENPLPRALLLELMAK